MLFTSYKRSLVSRFSEHCMDCNFEFLSDLNTPLRFNKDHADHDQKAVHASSRIFNPTRRWFPWIHRNLLSGCEENSTPALRRSGTYSYVGRERPPSEPRAHSDNQRQYRNPCELLPRVCGGPNDLNCLRPPQLFHYSGTTCQGGCY